jgi:predicted GNAT family acetyltransferase
MISKVRVFSNDNEAVISVQLEITNNTKRSRFEAEVNGEYAFVEYQFYKEDIALMHTYVPEAARGRGIASLLAKFALDSVKKQGLKLMVFCPTIAKYIRMHPEYEVLLDQQYRR